MLTCKLYKYLPKNRSTTANSTNVRITLPERYATHKNQHAIDITRMFLERFDIM